MKEKKKYRLCLYVEGTSDYKVIHFDEYPTETIPDEFLEILGIGSDEEIGLASLEDVTDTIDPETEEAFPVSIDPEEG